MPGASLMVVLGPVAVSLKLRLLLLPPRMLHLYVLSSEPSSARLPAASSSTTAPVGPEEGIDCRSLGEPMRAVGCDMSPIQSIDWGSDAVDARVAVLVVALAALLLLARDRRERRGVLLPVVAPLLTPPLLSPLLTPSLLLMTPVVPSGGRACARAADSLACPASDGDALEVLRLFFLVGLTPAVRPAAGSACGKAAAASVVSSCRGAACVSAAATAADAYAACAALNLSLPLMLLLLSHCHVALGLSLWAVG